ncbi:MAG: hypothetical protein AAGA90_09790 [Actinomycetota bacterium]
MNARLRIGFARPDHPDDIRVMEFALRNTSLATRFAQLVDRASVPGHGFLTSWSMGAETPDVDRDVATLNGHIDAFNTGNVGTALIDQRVATTTVDRRQLNDIHEQFEGHLKAHQSGRTDLVAGPRPIIDALHGVNLSVHRLEASLDRVKNPGVVYSYFTASVAADGSAVKEPLEDTDYADFTMEEHFGILYANYATTGKNLQHIFWTEDYELLEAGGASPQQVLSSGVLAQFNSRRKRHEDEWARFARWFDDNDIARYGYRLDDERNSLGMLKLGALVPSADTRRHYSRLRRHWDARSFVNDFAPYRHVASMTIEG